MLSLGETIKMIRFFKKISLKKMTLTALCFVCLSISVPVQSGGDIPWPLDVKLMPFPWGFVDQTVWRIEGVNGLRGTDSYLRLHTLGSVSDVKILAIEEFDKETGEILSSGRGVEGNQLVQAVMLGTNGFAFRLVIRHYKDKNEDPSFETPQQDEKGMNSLGASILPLNYVDCEEGCGLHFTLHQVLF